MLEFTTPPTPNAGCSVEVSSLLPNIYINILKKGGRGITQGGEEIPENEAELTIILPIRAKALTPQSLTTLPYLSAKPNRPCLLYKSNPRRCIGVEIN